MMSFRHRRFLAAGKEFDVDRVLEWQQQRRCIDLISKLKSTKQHNTCIVVGNGPSLNSTDLSQLAHADVFISNFAYEHEELRKRASLLAIVNHLVAEQADLTHLDASIPLLAPSHLSYAFPSRPEAFYLPMATTPEFQLTPRFGVSCQSTVTYFLLQIAYWIGYQRVLLIGVDNNYVQPEVSEGDVLKQQGPDLNHFSGTYFQGKQWHAADVDRMAATYELARSAYAAAGRSIVDCTVGGQLTVFPKVGFAEALLDRESADVPSAQSDASKILQMYQWLEHYGLPLLVVSLVTMMLVLLIHFLSETLVPESMLTKLVAVLTVLLVVSGAGIVRTQVRRMEVRMRFELSALRFFVSRQKNSK